ncbi:28S ribosomal protein S21, mitochondrial [Frankliniella fusca]|uniref:28S ribosomal protein S21, mitochondrial n=1 Tax=Frankliniella fusca TaxID=407009 RepID=A0AAE1LEL8_9NEOP|nr:28S ribosomal protein S21, mitochondrial [Frankliniella fusca]
MRHASFIARTVLVKNGGVDEAMALLNNVMSRDGFFEQFRRTRFYEKPFEMRRRVNYTKCRAIYNEEMSRRLAFLMRTNRTDPYPGSS